MTAPAGLEACDFVDTIPVFDAHKEYDATGREIRDITRSTLQAACDYANSRANRNHYGAIGPGHSILRGPDGLPVPEMRQPPVWGFHANHRVKQLPDGTDAIFVDRYAKRGLVDDGTGNKVAAKEALREFPYVSVEYWTVSADGKRIPGFIDRVALLRQTPKRDLGVTMYSKGGTIPAPTRRLFARPDRTNPIAATVSGNVLFYSMESAMIPAAMSPTDDADATKPGLDDVEGFIEQLKAAGQRFPKLAALLVEEPPVPEGDPMAADPMAPPGGDLPPMPDEGPEMFAKMDQRTLANKVYFLTKTLKSQQDAVAAMKKAKEDEVRQYSKADAERILDDLQANYGLDFDRGIELPILEALPIGEKRTARADYMKRTFKPGVQAAHAPRGGMLPTAPNGQTGMKSYSKAAVQAAVEYHQEHPETPYEECLAKFQGK